MMQALRGAYPVLPPLKYDWRAITYTDGSLRDTKDGKIIGAAVYCPDIDTKTKLLLTDLPNKTINVAELAAIHHAMERN